MDSSFSPKDEICFLLVCLHISNAVYHTACAAHCKLQQYKKEQHIQSVSKILGQTSGINSLNQNKLKYVISANPKKKSSFNHADHSYKLTCQRIPCATLFFPGSPIQPKYIIYNMIRCVFPVVMLLFMPLYCRCLTDICDEFRRPCCCLYRHIAVVIAM
jgi:hypothetical protein